MVWCSRQLHQAAGTYSSSLSSSFLSSHLFSYKVIESRVSVTFVILLRNYYKRVEWNFSFLFLNWITVVYNVVLITSVQQSDSVIHIHTFFFYSFPWWFIMGLNIVLCVIQKDLVFLQFLLYLLGQFLQWRLHFCKSTTWWKLEAGCEERPRGFVCSHENQLPLALLNSLSFSLSIACPAGLWRSNHPSYV